MAEIYVYMTIITCSSNINTNITWVKSFSYMTKFIQHIIYLIVYIFKTYSELPILNIKSVQSVHLDLQIHNTD